jgi:2'-5' RNA ligase
MDEQEHKHLFIGIPVDDHCQQQINVALQTLQQSRNDIRWVEPANRHLTLAFIGNTSAEGINALQKNFARAYEGTRSFSFLLNELCRFPNEHGRILAATHPPTVALSILQNKTLALLERSDIASEPLTFRPHITLGKIQNAKHVSEDFRQTGKLSLNVRCVNLYESTTQDEARIYKVLLQAPFLP